MSAGLRFERPYYFVSEGDGFVDVCVNLYERQGLTVALHIFTGSSTARGIVFPSAGNLFCAQTEILAIRTTAVQTHRSLNHGTVPRHNHV